MMMSEAEIVDVGPRDGFQSVGPMIPTGRKISIIRALHAAGLRRLEATSFISTSAVPQLADAAEVLEAAQSLPDLDAQVLVPTARQAERALRAGATHLAFVLSVSERHNQSNVRRSPAESGEEYMRIADMLPSDARLRLNIATAFDCPFEGRVDSSRTIALLDALTPIAPSAEIALCDTTGKVTPAEVRRLFEIAAARFPAGVRWAFHGHDTYGMGAANCLAAWNAGVRTFDASIGGLGGCPFAPGATGNVATEDLVWMLQGMDVACGIDLGLLAAVADDVARLPGASVGGRVRVALGATRRTAEDHAT